MNVCGVANRWCSNLAEIISKTIAKLTKFRECNCLPACTSIEYNANIDQVQFDMEAIKRVGHLNANKSR